MNVREKLAAKAYEVTLPYPTTVREPAVLRKTARDLTAEEFATLPQVKADYEIAKAAEKEARDAYYRQMGELTEQFRRDVEAENDMIGHPKASLLWSKAWEMGHSAGLGEVLTYYEDLVELVQ